MLEYTTTIVTAPEATTATAAQWEHCIGLTVQAHTELTLRLPKSKAGALAVLARLTAAVEALPDDPHAGQGVLPTAGFVQPMESPYSTTSSPTITAPMTTESPLCVSADVGSYRSMQILCTKPAEHEGEHENGEYTWPDPVWRTLTFGDLRAGDVVKLDEDGPVETVNTSEDDDWGWWLATSQRCGHYYEEDPVLVRHPRPEVGQ